MDNRELHERNREKNKTELKSDFLDKDVNKMFNNFKEKNFVEKFLDDKKNSENLGNYKFKNKKNAYAHHFKINQEMNIITNSDSLKDTNPDNITKYNEFVLKNFYYQKRLRSNTEIFHSEKNNLTKINENSESDPENLKKIPSKNNSNELLSSANETEEKTEEKFQGKNEEENIEKNEEKTEQKIEEKKDFLNLKNFNTKDTTSSISNSENSLSLSNSNDHIVKFFL